MNNLKRFTEAQYRDYEQALKEIKNGRKESHWMWYIFPQLKGLGRSYCKFCSNGTPILKLAVHPF